MMPLLRRNRLKATIPAVYGAIVAQARHPAFYLSCGVPDTVDGRLGMIVLHLSLLLRRLAGGSPEMRDFGQQLFDHFCGDMDDNLREMGVGDLAVPRRMRSIGEQFYGQAAAYDAALATADRQALADALGRNILGPDPGSDAPVRLSLYVFRLAEHLAKLDPASILAGELPLPDPAAIIAAT